MALSLTVNVKGAKEFSNVMAKYALWNKRQPAEIVNAKLYFVAANAMNTTKKADKATIVAKLNAPARVYPSVPLAAILVNKQLGAKGKKGLTGAKMKTAVEKYSKKATQRTQFLRSGWLNPLKTLDYFNKRGDIAFVKRFAPKKPQGVRQIGKPKGTAVYARPDSVRAWGKIGNYIGQGKQASKTVYGNLKSGLEEAIQMEMRSMVAYIRKKYEEEINRVNKTNTFK